jgi:ppGpp synthetase/RelA/SpoT-type nucleotidyltranferase
MTKLTSERISLRECEGYIHKIKADLAAILQSIEVKIIESRDKGLPVYSTKCRLKSADSVFLKVKRKKKSLSEIKDYAGLRILCLFEKDLYEVHKFLVDAIKQEGDLEEFKIFNWEKEDERIFRKEIDRVWNDYGYDNKKKKSGYRSIHYIIRIKHSHADYYIEIQMRTLLQDAWGELEHYLSYKKGVIDPYIKTGFDLLSKNFETHDNLLTDLRSVSDKQGKYDLFLDENYKPGYYFDYEDTVAPKKLFGMEKIIPLLKEYGVILTKLKGVNLKSTQSREVVAEARSCFNKIWDEIGSRLYKADKEVRYWVDMENAFFLFFENKIHESKKIYEDLKQVPELSNRYVLNFRLGEIYFSQNNIVRALDCFDESERQLSLLRKPCKINIFRIKVRLALNYWALGPEYIEIAIEQINEAERLLHAKNSSFPNFERLKILTANNVCWYYLEKYIKSEGEKDPASNTHFLAAKKKYEELVPLLLGESFPFMYDTTAWFCYHAYKKTKIASYLEKSIQYCSQMRDKWPGATFNSMQMGHIQEIMNAK